MTTTTTTTSKYAADDFLQAIDDGFNRVAAVAEESRDLCHLASAAALFDSLCDSWRLAESDARVKAGAALAAALVRLRLTEFASPSGTLLEDLKAQGEILSALRWEKPRYFQNVEGRTVRR